MPPPPPPGARRSSVLLSEDIARTSLFLSRHYWKGDTPTRSRSTHAMTSLNRSHDLWIRRRIIRQVERRDAYLIALSFSGVREHVHVSAWLCYGQLDLQWSHAYAQSELFKLLLEVGLRLVFRVSCLLHPFVVIVVVVVVALFKRIKP